MILFSRLYDRVLALSQHKRAPAYLAGLSFIEAIVFPVPPDVMLAPMVLANRAAAWRLAFYTTAASVVGGCVGFLLGYLAIELIHPWIVSAGYEEAFLQAEQYFRRYGVWFVIVAGFSPVPYKIVTIVAGALGVPLAGFLLGSFIGRGGRFFMVAGLIWLGGDKMAAKLRRHIELVGWVTIGVTVVALLIWWRI